MDAATLVSILALFPILWLYTAYMSASAFPSLRGKRILLLIAHPDDEAMFFAPTVQALTKEHLGNHLKILCLSSGNADGLGETRKLEIVKSANILGVKSEDVLVLEDSLLADSPNPYPSGHLPGLLQRTFAPSLPSTPPTSAPTASIDALITFDRYGVSSHSNHISCNVGAVAFLKQLMSHHAGWECPVALYTLTSVNILRKYASVVDAVGSVVACIFSMIMTTDKERRGLDILGKKGQSEYMDRRIDKEGENNDKGMKSSPSWLFFVNGPGDWYRAQKAMVSGHRSQMVWFRWGWISLGRYMIVNDLRRVKV